MFCDDFTALVQEIDADYKDISSFRNAVNRGECAWGAKVDLRSQANAQALALAQAIADILESGHCPEGVEIYLCGTTLTSESIAIIFRALKSDLCPGQLTLDLQHCQIGSNFDRHTGKNMAIETIAAALKNGEHPQGLMLNIESNEMYGNRILLDAVANAVYPEVLGPQHGYGKTDGVQGNERQRENQGPRR